MEKGQEITTDNMKSMEKWVKLIIKGYHGIKDILDKKKAMKDKELIEEVKDKFNGTVIEETDEEYVTKKITDAVKNVGAKNKNKVLYQVKNGNITRENLEACLSKIEAM